MTRHSTSPTVRQAITPRRCRLKAVALGAASTALALLAAPVTANLVPPSNAQSGHFLVAVNGQQDPRGARPARGAEPSG
jgi:hypothetical protein